MRGGSLLLTGAIKNLILILDYLFRPNLLACTVKIMYYVDIPEP